MRIQKNCDIYFKQLVIASKKTKYRLMKYEKKWSGMKGGQKFRVPVCSIKK
jgi:hypothetical protein